MRSERESLLAAIMANPDDDLPRLIFADWLEENGEPERAEFIRVQCELAGMSNEKCKRGDELEKREMELFRHGQNAFDWMGEVSDNYAHLVSNARGLVSCVAISLSGRADRVTFHRGFVSHISLTLAAFMGTGTTPAYGAQVCREHPVTSVLITDREPFRHTTSFSWYRQTGLYERLTGASTISPELFDLLEGGRILSIVADYRTREAAITALSSACLRWARTETGKPKEAAVSRKLNAAAIAMLESAGATFGPSVNLAAFGDPGATSAVCGGLLSVVVDVPPSVNNLFRAGGKADGGKRFTTKAYKSWIALNAGKLASLIPVRSYPVGIKLTIEGKLRKGRDIDNLCKAIIDCLVRVGILADDNWEHVHSVAINYRPKECGEGIRVEVVR